MNPLDWLKLPLLQRIATLLVGVFFGQRFDGIGHNEVVPGAWVEVGPDGLLKTVSKKGNT